MSDTERYIVQFPQERDFRAALASEIAPSASARPLTLERHHLFAVRKADEASLARYRDRYGARVVEDFRFAPEPPDRPGTSGRPGAPGLFEPERFGPDVASAPSLEDVTRQIRAPEVWARGERGAGAIVAIIDSGVNGARAEFPEANRAGGWAPPGESPWEDPIGHGTMCASIACGSREAGGAFNGVAPDASLVACRTSFYTSELIAIYDYLIELAGTLGRPLVASNSFGVPTGTPPDIPAFDLLSDVLDDATAAGIAIVFSAGNYHALAGGDPTACEPTSIWHYKCREDLLAVGTCDLDGTLWFYSSRGPGQLFGEPGTNGKPDVLAPTPANGRVLYGDAVRALADGWGTSGACPQVSGLLALLRSRDPSLPLARLRDIVRDTGVDQGLARDCQGTGRIDAAAAFARLDVAPPA